jgi:hypothetical protein
MRISSTSPRYQKGWNDALHEVSWRLGKVLGGTKNGREWLAAANAELSSLRDRSNVALTNWKLARKYEISPRTVTYWRREGCPFKEGKNAVLDWGAKRRYLPKAMEKKFERSLDVRRTRIFMAPLKECIEIQRIIKELCSRYDGFEMDDYTRRFRCRRSPKGVNRPRGKVPLDAYGEQLLMILEKRLGEESSDVEGCEG